MYASHEFYSRAKLLLLRQMDDLIKGKDMTHSVKFTKNIFIDGFELLLSYGISMHNASKVFSFKVFY